VESVSEPSVKAPLDEKKVEVRKSSRGRVRTARKDEHVIAKAGDRVIAERNSKVVANEGSYVIALDGSKVIAAPGSEVVMYRGSMVINPYGQDDTLTRIIAMDSACLQKDGTAQQPRSFESSSTVAISQVSSAGTVSIVSNDPPRPVIVPTSDNEIFAGYSTLEDQLSSLNLVYHAFAASKSRSFSEWRSSVDRRKFVGK
jgi:hypothetical protein